MPGKILSSNEEAYKLFAKVMLIYPLNELRKLTGIKTGYTLNNLSYLNPALLEKQGYTILIRNKITTIKNYHQDIRFLLKENEIPTLEKILEKKGFRNAHDFLVTILTKSINGMMAIAEKKLPSLFSYAALDNTFDLGNIEKFLCLEYTIKLESYPPISLVQIVHEKVFEDFTINFMEENPLTLPYSDLVNYLALFLNKALKAEYKNDYFFYPRKVALKNHLRPTQYNTDIVCKIEIPEKATTGKFYLFLSNPDNRRFDTGLLSVIKKAALEYLTYPAVTPGKEITFTAREAYDRVQKAVLKDCLVVTYYFQYQKSIKASINIILPYTYLASLSEHLLHKHDITIHSGNADSRLTALNDYIKHNLTSSLEDFTVVEKKNLVLDVHQEEDKPEKTIKMVEKKIVTEHDILRLEDKYIQRAISRCKKNELIIILKTNSEALKEKILSNMSKNARAQYEDDLTIKQSISRGEIKAYNAKFKNTLNTLLQEE